MELFRHHVQHSEKMRLSTFKVQLFIVQNLSKTFSYTRHFMAVQIGSPLGNRVTTFSRTLLEGREKECEFFHLHGFTWWNRDIWVKSNGGRQASEDESKKCRRMPFHFFSTLSELIWSESKLCSCQPSPCDRGTYDFHAQLNMWNPKWSWVDG